MIKDMYHIQTKASEDSDWVWRLQSISPEYLKTRGNDWLHLGFIREFRILDQYTFKNSS